MKSKARIHCPACKGKGDLIGKDRLGTYRQITCPVCCGKARVPFGQWLDYVAWVIVGTRGDKQ